MNPLLILSILAVAALLWVIVAFNGLVRLRNEVRNAWSQIEVQLKRRYDLIPNLVETVRGYAKHEKETLDAVTRARAAASGAVSVAQQGAAQGPLMAALGRLFAVAEQYPDLKANAGFLSLQEELASTENRVGFARQFYNDAVMQFNTATETIPTNLVAGIGGFRKAEFFEIEAPAERSAPQVKF
jgi:LemA protein